MSTETPKPEEDPADSAGGTASETTPTAVQETSKSAADAKAPAKHRSPVERAAVWTVIAVLGVLALIELRASWGYSSSKRSLESFMQDNPDAEQTLAHARQRLFLAPAETKPDDGKKTGIYKYEWFSLFKSGQYVLKVAVAEDEGKLVVLGFETSNPPEPKKPKPAEDDEEPENDGADDAGGNDAGADDAGADDAGADDAETARPSSDNA